MSHLSPFFLLSPTYGPDVERFALLRRSLRLFAPGISHLAFVEDEDLPLFRKRFGHEAGLELRSVDAVLPRDLSAQRRYWRSWRGWAVERVGWRLGLERCNVTGWKVQQCTKIAALAERPDAAFVFLDSDTFLCGPIAPADFLDDDGLLLQRTPATTLQDFAYEFYLSVILRYDPPAPARGFNHIQPAPAFWGRTARSLIKHLDAFGTPWWKHVLRTPLPSEYNLLGFAASELESLAGYRLDGTLPDTWGHVVVRPQDLGPALQKCREERGSRRFFVLQSNISSLGPDALARCHALLDDLAAGTARLEPGANTRLSGVGPFGRTGSGG